MATDPGSHDYYRRRRNQSRGSRQIGSRGICPQALYRRSDQGEAGRNSRAGDALMNLNEIIVKSITDSTLQVFSTMLGVDVTCGEAGVENSMPEANEGVVSFI